MERALRRQGVGVLGACIGPMQAPCTSHTLNGRPAIRFTEIDGVEPAPPLAV